MRSRSRTVLAMSLVGLAALLGSTLWPPRAAPQDAPRDQASSGQPSSSEPSSDVLEDRRASFEGTWHLEQSPREARQVIDAAVDRTVEAMSFFVRGIARSRLREGTPIQREIQLRFEDDDRLTVRFGENDRYTTTLGRTEVRVSPEGQRMRVTQRFRPGGQLVQAFETDQGSRTYVYTPTGEGRLHLETTTGSPRLPRPMYFELDYTRR